ncbi:MAG TPA: hypothetical protein VMA32_06615 [Streptosporangiaceae bacterium]|nr:hypothetical protein [Streptosporangiaceae bacterium]
MTKPLWAQPACDPDLPADLRVLIARGRPAGDALAAGNRRAWAPRRWRRQRDLGRHSDKIIFPHDLHGTDRLLLARAQNAVDTILGSQVRVAGLLEADEPALRRHEWDIACTSRELTRVRALPGADAEAGAMTAAVLEAQQRALALAEEATISRIRALERYAEQVAAADDAHRDWQAALRQSGLNDFYLDLVARTAADELAVTELDELTDRAAITAQVLTSSLRDANVAAAVVALPQAQAG